MQRRKPLPPEAIRATLMLSFLFPRLTRERSRGAALFEALVRLARQPHWFVEGQLPDTIDGRFAVLATIVAIATVRLERGGDSAVALTERFVEAMDAEHRQLGIGDPTVGKTVRKLVGALDRRVGLWQRTPERRKGWEEAVRISLFRDMPPERPALDHCEAAVRAIWARLEAASDDAVADGRFE
ncbi:MAG: ubiquinol-cytochrome C chaperone family protein [Sphingomicrobium sp.]